MNVKFSTEALTEEVGTKVMEERQVGFRNKSIKSILMKNPNIETVMQELKPTVCPLHCENWNQKRFDPFSSAILKLEVSSRWSRWTL